MPQPVAQIPWGHNIVLLEKLKQPLERRWSAVRTMENGWSRAILTQQIESRLYHRRGKSINNLTCGR
ncbi:MAG: hypothetical protein K2W95_33055 [Candidatus Obscuribacterales bacterium]|nr:hypothetical protein [Candidatus Obscuribacterales bacterium]